MTPEDRIRAHFKGLKRRHDWRQAGMGEIWMRLARQWKRPIREIKEIVHPDLQASRVSGQATDHHQEGS